MEYYMLLVDMTDLLSERVLKHITQNLKNGSKLLTWLSVVEMQVSFRFSLTYYEQSMMIYFVLLRNCQFVSVYIGVVSLNGLLYVVGGDDGSANLASVEVYNPKTDSWSMLPSSMGIGRSYAGVAIIDKPM